MTIFLFTSKNMLCRFTIICFFSAAVILYPKLLTNIRNCANISVPYQLLKGNSIMKSFIKIMALILAFLCVISLASCGDSSNNKKDNGKNNAQSKDEDKGGNGDCSHSFGEWKVEKEPDCQYKGSKSRECSKCDLKQYEAIPVGDHKYGDYTVTKAASCKNTGTQTRTCTACKKTETETIPKSEHNFGDGSALKCSVCLEANYSVGTQGLLFTLQTAKDPYPDTYKVSCGTAITATYIVIPSTYKGKAVTYIDEEGFTAAEKLVNISIPASVKRIGDNAFVDCTKLESVGFQSGSQLENMTGFLRCTSLASIRVPASVTRVDASAFRGCTALNGIYFDDTNGWYCGYMGTPGGKEIDAADSHTAANTFKYEANNYYYFKLTTPTTS